MITKHGRPAGVLLGFASEDDWFDFRLENDPRFFKKIAEARASVRDGRGVSWEHVKKEDDERTTVCASRRVPRRKRGSLGS